MNKEVKGFKVFNADWTCRGFQYEVGKTYEHDGEISMCNSGFHFCKKAADCFNYYRFDSTNKVAEVVATGKVIEEGDKCCTNRIMIVKELNWHEVLELVNSGYRNSGNSNSGHWNSGNSNSGNSNSGHWNSGNWNSGSGNSGDRNSGDNNSGNRNSGYINSGHGNSGHSNSGHWNSGSGNSGNWNISDGNSGNRNSGDNNSGNSNSGHWNSGDWNISDGNSGCFNTKEHYIKLFDRDSNWTYEIWSDSKACDLLNDIELSELKWTCSAEMTDEEKEANPAHKTTGGYLKKQNKKETAQAWWNNLSKRSKREIKSIPNFDAEIFEQCTGIKVD